MIAEYIKLEWDKKRDANFDLGPIDIQAHATIVPYKATVIASNAEVCQLDGMLQADSYDLSVAFASGQSYMVKFWQQSTNIGTIKSLLTVASQTIKGEESARGAMMPKIYDAAGSQIGQVTFIPVNQSGLQSYYYLRLSLVGQTLDCYIVGVKRVTYFCMYDQAGNMVATVKKGYPVRNGKSRYTLYIGDDAWAQVVILLTAITHQLEYEDHDVQGLHRGGEKLITFQKELLAKFQPGFIEQVTAQAGAANLPENMPLVKQKVHESQNTPQIIMKRISFIALMLALALIFGFAIFGTKK